VKSNGTQRTLFSVVGSMKGNGMRMKTKKTKACRSTTDPKSKNVPKTLKSPTAMELTNDAVHTPHITCSKAPPHRVIILITTIISSLRRIEGVPPKEKKNEGSPTKPNEKKSDLSIEIQGPTENKEIANATGNASEKENENGAKGASENPETFERVEKTETPRAFPCVIVQIEIATAPHGTEREEASRGPIVNRSSRGTEKENAKVETRFPL